jgi:hypothetical protein
LQPAAPKHTNTEKSIKLGLGDFVFYSVLVSKAALYGFATCAACFLVIVAVRSVGRSCFGGRWRRRGRGVAWGWAGMADVI